jgi:phage regulator Rha-like protein
MEDNQTNEITVQKNKKLPEIEISEDAIKYLIYEFRGQQVMLDSDLAMLYQVETKVFNQAVKRNIERFPENYRFQLTKEEFDSLRSQNVTSNGKGGRRYMPYVFTEQGIAMLSAVLRSDVAVQISIKIMNTFVEMRRFLMNNSLMFERINEIEVKQLAFQKSADERFDEIFKYISEHEETSQKIFFDGQIYDAFSLLVDLVLKADKKLVLVDNYVDVGTVLVSV